MTWFVDASVIVAILGHEEDWKEQADRLESDDKLLWSALSRWESVAALKSRLRRGIEEVLSQIDQFAEENGFTLVPIGAREADTAVAALRSYGKGSGHPAQLNMGDCFAYACAKANGAKLLYKGNDFIHTDLA